MELIIKDNWNPKRYGILEKPHKSEIVMLRGRGCFHSKCSFCDYYLDMCDDNSANFKLNKSVLDNVVGIHGELEVICSGSFQELDKDTLNYIKQVCDEKGIKKLSLECHWKYKDTLEKHRNFFVNQNVFFRIGVETFDTDFRENCMNKNMGVVEAKEISKYFDYCNLIVGIKGQTKENILSDIEIARNNFKRVCIGVFEENSTLAKQDKDLVEWFEKEISNELREDSKFQVLINSDDYPLGDGCMTLGGENNE